MNILKEYSSDLTTQSKLYAKGINPLSPQIAIRHMKKGKSIPLYSIRLEKAYRDCLNDPEARKLIKLYVILNIEWANSKILREMISLRKHEFWVNSKFTFKRILELNSKLIEADNQNDLKARAKINALTKKELLKARINYYRNIAPPFFKKLSDKKISEFIAQFPRMEYENYGEKVEKYWNRAEELEKCGCPIFLAPGSSLHGNTLAGTFGILDNMTDEFLEMCQKEIFEREEASLRASQA